VLFPSAKGWEWGGDPAASSGRRRSHWGWGYEDEKPDTAALRAAVGPASERLGFSGLEPRAPVAAAAVRLRAPRLQAPSTLEHVLTADHQERLTHALGRAYRDVVRAVAGEFDHPPDLVAHPGDEAELERVLGWCADANAAAIAFGGGTSVVGGIELRGDTGHRGVVSIDLRRLDRVSEIDTESLAARIDGGATGPGLEEQLRPHGLSVRHYPQSFEHSTLGGWIATRAGGHYATRATHIDDRVESIRALTPSGWWESLRLPGSGAGPSPDRLLLGSEGTLGIITSAWVRLVRRPEHRASRPVTFRDFPTGLGALRAISQSGLDPATCRLVDPDEARITGALDTGDALMLLGFESADHPVDADLERALELARESGGEPAEAAQAGDTSASWRSAFLAAPHLRDVLICLGVLVETFETATTWDRLGELVDRVRADVTAAVRELCGEAIVTCRITHVYPDGAAPYFSVFAPAPRGREVESWDEIKAVASEVIGNADATINHPHAVGRDHRPGYDRQRPEPFARALTATKAELDPDWLLNPGVLIDRPAVPQLSGDPVGSQR
ncbi:MAG: FAD-binding oxidoreductase, partial [Solirubrobacterales bacterium]